MLPLNAFRGEEHQPFLWEAGESAALLVHGFPGTPAEMRPTARCLHNAGWTVRGILLPGFGPQIETLPRRTYGEWIEAVYEALIELQRRHHPVMLIGHSMGGALALQTAIRRRPDGLVLMAPFWQIEHGLWKLLPVLKHVFPQVRPFRRIKLDFNDPETRAGIHDFMPDADLDDPNMQAAIREIPLPLAMFDQIRALGQLAYTCAPDITAPTLVIQGTLDDLVRPRTTRRLVDRLRAPVRYLEVAAEHNLVASDNGCWTRVENAVLDFAASLVQGQV